VSSAGGLGLVGGGYCDRAWLTRELDLLRQLSSRPWGVGLITWSCDRSIVDPVLARRAHAVMLSFGAPRPHAAVIKAAGCRLICQVQGQAAALALGAQGVLIGTRFFASDEALGSPRAKRSIVEGSADGTQRTTVFDIVRSLDWPAGTTGRALRNPFMARWHGRERELPAVLDTESAAFHAALRAEDFDTAMVWAGEGGDLNDAVAPTGTLVKRISAEAEQCIARASGLCRQSARE
jgi:nitronate monooxygenase